MARRGLIIGIDYSDHAVLASYYSYRHERAESITLDNDTLRYVIPSVLCYDESHREWLMGNDAIRYSEESGAELLSNFLENILDGKEFEFHGNSCTYTDALAVFFGKLLDSIQLRTAVMRIESITISVRGADRKIKEALEKVFETLKIDVSKVRLLNEAESFAYYVICEDEALWKNGAILMDFNRDGFFAKQLLFSAESGRSLVYVSEHELLKGLDIDALVRESSRREYDLRLSKIYNELVLNGRYSSVFFTGEGFEEPWYEDTLSEISKTRRVFRGNNIYAMGACMAGFFKENAPSVELPIICEGRTKADICVEAFERGALKRLVLSAAAVDWYDAGAYEEFILNEDMQVNIIISSFISGRETVIPLNVAEFADRPSKTRRVSIEVKYTNDTECTVKVSDLGFGDFYAPQSKPKIVNINVEEYI